MNTKHVFAMDSSVFVLHVSFYSRIPFAHINCSATTERPQPPVNLSPRANIILRKTGKKSRFSVEIRFIPPIYYSNFNRLKINFYSRYVNSFSSISK